MISNNGLPLIKYFEGCELKAYQDSGGIWTIGYGHTKSVSEGNIITQEQADDYLLQDLANAEHRVHIYVTKTDLQQCQLDSLISQAYNIRSFPALANHLNKDGEAVYLDKLLLYCHDAKGNELLGLKKRRYAERRLFEGQTWNEILTKINDVTS